MVVGGLVTVVLVVSSWTAFTTLLVNLTVLTPLALATGTGIAVVGSSKLFD